MKPQKCHYCDDPATTRDHIVPRSMVRELRLDQHHSFPHRNIVPACAPCNHRKDNLDSGCTCDRCTEAWYEYEQLAAARRNQPALRVAYSTETLVEPDIDITDLFRR